MGNSITDTAIIEALQKAAQEHGMKGLAAHLDKQPSTLYSELNPYTEPGKAKMGLLDALRIMEITNDHAALVLVADALGYRLESACAVPDHTDVRDECLDDSNALAQFHALARDPEVPPPALTEAARRVHKDIDETLAAHWQAWEIRHGR